MPTPNKDETEDAYMTRCMAYPDMQKYEPSQRAAVCHSKYREAKANTTLVEGIHAGSSQISWSHSKYREANATEHPKSPLAVFSEPMQIVEDSSCCLKVNAVIAKEGVYTFPAGPNGEDKQCLWSRQELLKEVRTARTAKVIIKDHPPNKVITSQQEIHGSIEKPFFDRDRIRAVINLDKEECPPDFLEGIRAAAAKTGPPRDVSQGFYYTSDETPGVWHGIAYDLIMRDMVMDHVAVGVWRGRCTFPSCGIGNANDARRFIAAASGLTVQKKVEGGRKGLSETNPKDFEEFVKLRKTEGYTEQQAKEYWDAYVGAKELPPATAKPAETPPKEPAKPLETPPAETTPPAQTPPAPAPELTTEQLIDRSKQLLNMREQSVIEKNRADRRHPT